MRTHRLDAGNMRLGNSTILVPEAGRASARNGVEELDIGLKGHIQWVMTVFLTRHSPCRRSVTLAAVRRCTLAPSFRCSVFRQREAWIGEPIDLRMQSAKRNAAVERAVLTPL